MADARWQDGSATFYTAKLDQGQEKCGRHQRQRSVAALKHRAAALGFDITPTASAT